VVTLADVTAALDVLYPPSLAEPWDAVGLVCGDPSTPVRRVLLAVDPTPEVAAEAVAGGFELLVTHHPLYLGGTTSVVATDPRGLVVHRLVRAGSALFVAHTNADRAREGVSDALAALFDLRDTAPLEAVPQQLDKLVVFVPVAEAEKLREALAEAGAGRIGDYDSCAWSTTGEGTFRPLPGANPAIGSVGDLERVQEVRLETVMPRAVRRTVLEALHATHPYETPAYDVVPLVDQPGGVGLGRVGDLPSPMPFGELVDRAARVLPPTSWGVRGAGDPAAVVSRLAVCGGSGDSAISAAAASGAQAFLTSDLKHHRTSERPVGLGLIDAAHWATEQPWLSTAAAALARVMGEDRVVETVLSKIRTDPWTTAARSPHA
jgi:dinuclear metal center YbgI/SA1388 family protein